MKRYTHRYTRGASGLGTVILTAFMSVIVTLAVVSVLLTYFGTERVAEEVSPFVEQTAERVTEGIVPPTERAEPKTEADLIMEAVASTQGSSVLIYRTTATGTETFVGRGLLVTPDGMVLTDTAIIRENATHTIAIPGVRDALTVTSARVLDDSLTLLTIPHTTTQVPRFTDAPPATGALVVTVTGENDVRIGTGIVTELTSPAIRTNIYGTVSPGSLLVTKEGTVVGLSTVSVQGGGQNSFHELTAEFVRSLR
jgi:hypothetical protein